MKNDLWNKYLENSNYAKNQEQYHDHILEQYKLYVEMADRISSRRNLANVFFLTLHTSIIAVIGFYLEKVNPVGPKWILVFPFLSFILLCLIWWWLITSYRNLNSAKYKVVGELEKKLPASPFWSAEWKELGEGKDITKYLPLTALEKYIPLIFAFLYIGALVYVIFSN